MKSLHAYYHSNNHIALDQLNDAVSADITHSIDDDQNSPMFLSNRRPHAPVTCPCSSIDKDEIANSRKREAIHTLVLDLHLHKLP